MIRSSFLAVLCVSVTAFLFAGETPTVTLTAPAANASFTLPTTLSLAATASVSGGTIAKVEFLNGTVKIGETTTSPYALEWTPTVPGIAQLTARATTDANDTGISAFVPVTLLPSLPYNADFEASEGYILGSLNNQLGWKVSSGDAQVITGTAAHGTQYVAFTPGASAAVVNQEFGSAASNPAITYVDFYTQPVAGTDTTTGTLFDLDAVRITCVLNDTVGQLQALDGDGLGSGTWKVLAPVVPLSTGNVAASWQRITVRLNYTAQTYDLYLNGVMIAADLRFRLAVTPYVSWFSVKGHTAASANLDNLYAGAANPLFADTNNNGLDDVWETAHGLSLSADNRSVDSDGDGLSNLQEYIAGSDPQDYYNGTLPVITTLVDASGIPGVNGLVSVKLTRSSDGAVLVNAPVTLKVTTGASQIAAAAGGSLATQVTVLTDASGIAAGYVTFGTQSSDTLVAAATSGSQTAALSITLNPPLIPPPTAGIRLWLKADSLNLASGSAVSSWTDSSGLNNHATQTDPTMQPTVAANTLNGCPVVIFNGSGQVLQLPDLMNANAAKGQSLATEGDAFVVWKSDKNADGTVRTCGMWNLSGDDWYPWDDGIIYEGFGTNVRYTTTAPAQSIDQYHIYNVTGRSGEWVSRINGLVHYRSSSNTVSWYSAPTLGRRWGGRNTKGAIAELIIYDRVLTTQERETVEGYLGRKYALFPAPDAPTDLTAVALSGNQVSLAWSATARNDQVVYEVERKSGTGEYSKIGETTSFGYNDSGLTALTGYSYRVRGRSLRGGTGAYSAESGVTTLDGNVPGLVTSGMRLWLSADNVPAGGKIKSWLDQSGKGNVATQSSATMQPTVAANALNGRPVVMFDGSGQMLQLPDLMNANSAKGQTLATEGDAFVVWKSDKKPDGTVRTCGMWNLSGDDWYTWSDGVIYDGFGSNARYTTTVPAQSIDQYHIYNVTSRSGEWVSRINGLVHYRSPSNTVSWYSAPALGRTWGGYATKGAIAELIIYDHVLTVQEREAVEGYLGRKYALFPAPEAPTDLTAVALSGTQVSLAWSALARTDLMVYEVERKSGTGEYSKIGETTSLGYSDSGLTPLISYNYRVRGRNLSGGTGAYSAETGVATLGENVPGLVTSGMRLWLSADNVPAGSKINSWPDRSGKGNDAIQSNPAMQPTVAANTLNGRPVVQFDGSGQILQLPDLMNANPANGQMLATEGDAFVVWKSDKNLDGTVRACAMWNLSGDDWYPWDDGIVYEGFGTNVRYATTVPAQSLDQYHIYNVASRSGEWIGRINGLVHYRSSNNTVSWYSAPALGGMWGGHKTKGAIAELIIYDHVLTMQEREAVAYYLNRKYALGLSAQIVGHYCDSNADGLTDAQDMALGLDPFSMDVDGDGVPNQVELINGTDLLNSDTDHDGVSDNLDAYPLDPTRWVASVADPNDHAGPTVTLTKPAEATIN